jgi:predicted PurR-regulated permease PerM
MAGKGTGSRRRRSESAADAAHQGGVVARPPVNADAAASTGAAADTASAPRSGPFALGLSANQRKLLRAAVTILALLVVVAAAAALGRVVVVFLRTFSNVFLPLAVAGILALVLNPFFEWLRDRARLPTPLAVVAVFLTLLLPVVAFFWFFGALAAEQIGDLFRRLPQWWSTAIEEARRRWPAVQEFFTANPIGVRLREAAAGQAGALAAGLQTMGGKALLVGASFLRGLGAVFTWAVLPVYLVFFLLADRSHLRDWEGRVLPFLKPETRRDVVYLGGEFVRLVVTFFRGQLIIAGAQAVLYALGFQLAGLRYGFILGLTLGLLNLIPYLGSIVGLGIALPLALFQEGGGWWLVAVVLGVFSVVQAIEAYLLTPRIMGDRTGLHPMAVIVAIFFWGTALDGILGMILAIPLTAFLVVAWRLARERYIGEWI